MNQSNCSIAAMLLAAAALTACDSKRDVPQPKVEPGSVAEKAERKIDEWRADARRELDEAKDKARAVGQDVTVAGNQASTDVREAGKVAADKVSDAVITTTVNAELARDDRLSANRIDVDTSAGRVSLRGSAPSAEARERATQLASHVKGVRSVDNQLTVSSARM